MKPHCISFTQSPLIVIRQDFVRICDGNCCSAAVLNQMMHWYEVKSAHKPQAEAANKQMAASGKQPTQHTDCWVWKSVSELHTEMLGAFGRVAVRDAVKMLLDKGYLLERENPTNKWDRTKQYLFQVQAVQAAVNGLNTDDASHLPNLANGTIGMRGGEESGDSICQMQSMHLPKSANAFAESSESTNQNQQLITETTYIDNYIHNSQTQPPTEPILADRTVRMVATNNYDSHDAGVVGGSIGNQYVEDNDEDAGQQYTVTDPVTGESVTVQSHKEADCSRADESVHTGDSAELRGSRTTNMSQRPAQRPNASRRQSGREASESTTLSPERQALYEELKRHGVGMARKLAATEPMAEIRKQIHALPFRKADDPAAVLANSITGKWSLPPDLEDSLDEDGNLIDDDQFAENIAIREQVKQSLFGNAELAALDPFSEEYDTLESALVAKGIADIKSKALLPAPEYQPSPAQQRPASASGGRSVAAVAVTSSPSLATVVQALVQPQKQNAVATAPVAPANTVKQRTESQAPLPVEDKAVDLDHEFEKLPDSDRQKLYETAWENALKTAKDKNNCFLADKLSQAQQNYDMSRNSVRAAVAIELRALVKSHMATAQ